MNIPKMPKIPTNIILEGLKLLFDVITSKRKETAEEVSQKDAMREGNEKINDISDINKSFDELIEGLKPEMHKLEDKIIDSLSYYLGDFVFLIEEKEKSLKTIKAKKISNKFERIQKKMKCNLLKELYKEISLDNQVCRDILSLTKGEKKKIKMEEFIQQSIDKSLYTIIADIKEEILYIAGDIESEIFDNLKSVELCQEEVSDVCEKLQNSLAEVEKDSIKTDAVIKITTIEAFQDIMKEVE